MSIIYGTNGPLKVAEEQKAMESRFQLLDDLFNADQKIRRASQHITSLNKMAVLQQRYIMAKQAVDERFLYIFQNRMLVIEELLNAYVKYADMKSKESIDLSFKLFGERPEPEIDG